ncbi:MAG: hypothetical protein UMU75_09220 [Halomonas sp.]|nr:hypothetical protein [Halomonas sp.]
MQLPTGVNKASFSGAMLTMAAMPVSAQDGHTIPLDELQPYELKIAEECRELAMQAADGSELEGKPLNETNAMKYVPGEEFELHLAFLGHGNTFFNVTCQISQDGLITYEDIDETGLPSAGVE